MRALLVCMLAMASAFVSMAQQPFQPVIDQPTPTFGTTVVIPGGLHGTVYTIPKDSTVLPDFKSSEIQRIGELWTDKLSILPRHWLAGFPGLSDRFEWFAIDYDGRFWIEQPGRYTFALVSDDGSRLFIDDVPVIDNDCQHSPDLRIAAVNLPGGAHRIRVSYFQGPRDCIALLLAIAGPNEHWKLFSTEDLKPPKNPDTWQFPASTSVSIVPVTPAEASLAMKNLFRQLGRSDPEEEAAFKSKKTKSCLAQPVRICSN